jgi:hypothetical protein
MSTSHLADLSTEIGWTTGSRDRGVSRDRRQSAPPSRSPEIRERSRRSWRSSRPTEVIGSPDKTTTSMAAWELTHLPLFPLSALRPPRSSPEALNEKERQLAKTRPEVRGEPDSFRGDSFAARSKVDCTRPSQAAGWREVPRTRCQRHSRSSVIGPFAGRPCGSSPIQAVCRLSDLQSSPAELRLEAL